MRVVKFISTHSKQKELSVAIRKNVNEYFKEKGISTKGNAAMFIKTLVMLSIYIVPFIILITVPLNIWIALSLIILMGIGEAGVGMSVMHDGAHGAYSKKNWVNNLIASTMYLLGSNLFNWKVQHNIMHHTFTNIYGFDPDIDTKSALRLSDHAPLKKFHRFQYIYAFFLYGLMTLSKLITDVGQLVEYNKSGMTEKQNRKPTQEITKLIVSKILYLSLILGLPLLYSDFYWLQILIGFSILHIIAGILMSTVFQMAHVVKGSEQPLPDLNDVIENEWIVHQLRTTSDFARNNHFLNWYVGGLNYQIEHHLFPNTCHIHYHKIAPIVEKTVNEFGFTYNLKPTFFDALVSHIQRLKELGKPVIHTNIDNSNLKLKIVT